MPLLSRPFRANRQGEWSKGKVVVFIVTLAAQRSVTLAARAAGMSRKSAYALKARDSAFCEAWAAALSAPGSAFHGDKAKRSGSSTLSSKPARVAKKPDDAMLRNRSFAAMPMRPRESPRVARSSRDQ